MSPRLDAVRTEVSPTASDVMNEDSQLRVASMSITSLAIGGSVALGGRGSEKRPRAVFLYCHIQSADHPG